MEENNVESTNQQPKEKLTPIMCPYCKSKNLAFVTEYHKSIGGRILFFLFLTGTLALLLYLLNGYSDDLLISTIAVAVITILIGIYVIVVESKTHIQCICKDCGFDWLKN